MFDRVPPVIPPEPRPFDEIVDEVLVLLNDAIERKEWEKDDNHSCRVTYAMPASDRVHMNRLRDFLRANGLSTYTGYDDLAVSLHPRKPASPDHVKAIQNPPRPFEAIVAETD